MITSVSSSTAHDMFLCKWMNHFETVAHENGVECFLGHDDSIITEFAHVLPEAQKMCHT